MRKVWEILFAALITGFIVTCSDNKPCVYNKEVINYYTEISTENEFGGNSFPIYKWTTNPVIKMFGGLTSQDSVEVVKIITELNSLQGEITLSITDTDNYNLAMHFIAAKDFSTILPISIKNLLGFAVFYDNKFTSQINEGIILIDTAKKTELYRNRIIREELTQVLGLPNDVYSELYPTSIFNGRIVLYPEKYEPIDRLLIQMHYSSVTKPGMTAEQLRELECWR